MKRYRAYCRARNEKFIDDLSVTGVEHYAVIFQLRIAGGGVLGLLWEREGGKWKIVSYQPLRQ